MGAQAMVSLSTVSATYPPTRLQTDAPRARTERHWDTIGEFVVETTYEDGQYVTGDLDNHAYGVGRTKAEAYRDWWTSLVERHQVLSEDRANLVPYLVEELKQLQSKLGRIYVSSTS